MKYEEYKNIKLKLKITISKGSWAKSNIELAAHNKQKAKINKMIRRGLRAEDKLKCFVGRAV